MKKKQIFFSLDEKECESIAMLRFIVILKYKGKRAIFGRVILG